MKNSLVLLLTIGRAENLPNVLSCQKGTYLAKVVGQSGRSCVECPWYCHECTDGSSCTRCFEGSIFSSPTNYCKCPAGQYMSAYSQKCKSCRHNCQKCSDYQTCTKCEYSFDLDYTGRCITCGPAKYFYKAYKFCGHCPKNCETCRSDDKCLACED